MHLSRRVFLSCFGTLTVAACSGADLSAKNAVPGGLPADLRPAANPGFSAWLSSFRPRARRAGIGSATLDMAFADAGYLPGVIARDRTQIQTRRTLEEYLSIATSDDRLAKGRAAFRKYKDTLLAIQSHFGVDARIIAAIWGMESQFGEKRGRIPVVSSTATLAFEGRRAKFYQAQLLAALAILEGGETTPQKLTGSWAGAMGHTQFIPTSYRSMAVDFTGDGRRDIWGENPADALASTANYLARNGWRNGLNWGAETGTPGPAGRQIQPQRGGPSFTVTRNFDVIKTYNNSDYYAIGVGHLADRLGGAGPLQGQFPPDENGLNKIERLEIQRGLRARGYDVGTIDGVIGAKTESAISRFQQSLGLPVTGKATMDVLGLVRSTN